MKRVLILGASHAEVPMLRAARELGCFVGTLGSDPAGQAAQLSDQHHVVDYSDSHRVCEVFEMFGYSAVVAGCNDFAAFSAAAVCDRFGAPGADSPEVTETLHNKARFRGLCETLGLTHPKSCSVPADQEIGSSIVDLRFPVLVKPVDLTGGKGITKCLNHADLDAAIRDAARRSRRSEIVVEEFVEGQLRSACYFIRGGCPYLLTHADEYAYKNPFLVAAALVPSAATPTRLGAVSEAIAMIAKELTLADGLLHLQYIATDHTDYLLEVCRRPPGDLYVMLPTRYPTVSIAELVVKNALGLPVVFDAVAESLPTRIRLCLMAERNGLVSEWEVSPALLTQATSVHELRPRTTEIKDHLVEKLGIVFAQDVNSARLRSFAAHPERGLEIEFV